MSGNAVYGSNSNRREIQNSSGFSISDNTLSFKVKVLLNKKADQYVITLGLNEEAATVENCNTQINQRIANFTSKINKAGIKKDAIYVDFISQTKIYDYTLSANKAEQFEKGFELKKNIIITVSSLKNIDMLVETASAFKIYDIIKIDYLSNNSSEIYAELLTEALKIAETKKNNYLKAFSKKSVGTPTATDEFIVITPETQYKNYKAFESSEFESYSNNASVLKKIARKNNTFYYDGISPAGMDKVINGETPEVGIQYFLTLTINYKLDTSL
jgi:uncharacterized protein YggE